jgi:hypothetical protein
MGAGARHARADHVRRVDLDRPAVLLPVRSSGGDGHDGLWVIGPRSKVRQGGYRWAGYANLYWLFKTIEENWSFARLGHRGDSAVGDLAPLFISQ